MRVIFAGTPEFARLALERLHAVGHTIALVLTQPDRPAGRGMKLQASAVKQYALLHHLPIAQPRSLRLEGKYPDDAQAARQAIEDAHADVMVVAAYGLILPQWVLDSMRGGTGLKLGCINIHASLLPRWRGAAPIHRAIEVGDSHTGVTIMQMDAGLDTGDMLRSQSVEILPNDTTGSLHDRLTDWGTNMLVQVLAEAQNQHIKTTPQAMTGISYAHKIEKSEAEIDWNNPTTTIERRIRAFNPFPGAFTSLNGEVIKVWAAHPGASGTAGADTNAAQPAPGIVLSANADGIVVATLDTTLVLTELQRAGGKRLAVADFLRGFTLEVGLQLGAS